MIPARRTGTVPGTAGTLLLDLLDALGSDRGRGAASEALGVNYRTLVNCCDPGGCPGGYGRFCRSSGTPVASPATLTRRLLTAMQRRTGRTKPWSGGWQRWRRRIAGCGNWWRVMAASGGVGTEGGLAGGD